MIIVMNQQEIESALKRDIISNTDYPFREPHTVTLIQQGGLIKAVCHPEGEPTPVPVAQG